jgi:predicted dehydrogenase
MLRLGLLSTARINDEILAAASQTERVEIVAVGSRESARAQTYAAQRGIPGAHGSYEALLADAVSTPSTSRCRTGSITSGR